MQKSTTRITYSFSECDIFEALSWIIASLCSLQGCEVQARRHRGTFMGSVPHITACAPQAKIVPQNKVTGPVPLECISGPVPPKILLVPPTRKQTSVLEQKYELTS